MIFGLLVNFFEFFFPHDRQEDKAVIYYLAHPFQCNHGRLDATCVAELPFDFVSQQGVRHGGDGRRHASGGAFCDVATTTFADSCQCLQPGRGESCSGAFRSPLLWIGGGWIRLWRDRRRQL